MRRFIGGLLASTTLTVIAPAASFAAFVAETEPNNSFATANSESAGNTIFGSLCNNNLAAGGCSPADTKDFFVFSGLTAGGSFDFDLKVSFNSSTLKFALFTDDTTFTDETDLVGNVEKHIVGTIPLAGALTLGVTTDEFDSFLEGYQVSLTVSSAVPEPASAVLLAAGLGGLAALRRRRRR
jgi:hypothetical protein